MHRAKHLLKMTWPATHFKDSRPGYNWGFNCMPWSGPLGQLVQGDAGNRHACCFLGTSLLVGLQWMSDLLNLPLPFILLKRIPTIPCCQVCTVTDVWHSPWNERSFCSSLSLGHDRSGLDVLTRHRIIHTDIKPDNLLMSLDKKAVKLSDFGCLFGCKEAEQSWWHWDTLTISRPYTPSAQGWSIIVQHQLPMLKENFHLVMPGTAHFCKYINCYWIECRLSRASW